jgi:hypothetical protein
VRPINSILVKSLLRGVRGRKVRGAEHASADRSEEAPQWHHPARGVRSHPKDHARFFSAERVGLESSSKHLSAESPAQDHSGARSPKGHGALSPPPTRRCRPRASETRPRLHPAYPQSTGPALRRRHASQLVPGQRCPRGKKSAGQHGCGRGPEPASVPGSALFQRPFSKSNGARPPSWARFRVNHCWMSISL